MENRERSDCLHRERWLGARLSESPIDDRYALGILDPEYREWREGGKPTDGLDLLGELPLLPVEAGGVCHLLGEPDEDGAKWGVLFFWRGIGRGGVSGEWGSEGNFGEKQTWKR